MSYPNPHGPSCPWYNITEKTGAPNVKWCEETLCQWISEPANTWSNLSYLIGGLFLLWFARKHKHNAEMLQFGPIIFFMGSMSFVYHLSNFYLSQILDFIGMFFFVGWTIGMNLIRLGKLKSKHLIAFNLIYSFINTLIMHVMYVNGIKYQVLIIISGLIICLTEYLARNIVKVYYKWFFATLASLILAFAFSIADGKRIWCNPTDHGWFSQGHAVWHWLAGLGMVLIFFHFQQSALEPQKKR
jgi:hypothetical protein